MLEGTNSKQQSDDTTSRSGCPGYRCLLWDWPRVALSQMKDLPLGLLGTAKGYIGCSMFKSNLRLSLIWNIQIVGALSETWLCGTLLSIRADSSRLHVEFSLGCWLYSHRVFPGRITVLTPSLPLALVPPPPQECFYSLKRSSSQDWLHVWAAPFLPTSFCSPVLVSVLELLPGCAVCRRRQENVCSLLCWTLIWQLTLQLKSRSLEPYNLMDNALPSGTFSFFFFF